MGWVKQEPGSGERTYLKSLVTSFPVSTPVGTPMVVLMAIFCSLQGNRESRPHKTTRGGPCCPDHKQRPRPVTQFLLGTP